MSRQINQNDRSLESYLTLLDLKSKSTKSLFKTTIANVNKFSRIDINNLAQYDEESIYDLLQEWIIWNSNRGITTSTLMAYFNSIRSYLWYRKIKLDQRDISHNLKFPKKLHERQTPITSEEIAKILSKSRLDFRFQFLALVSSGMRVGELGQIKLRDLDTSRANIVVNIPSQITKTGHSRITFFSTQVSNMIRYRIKNKKLSELLFSEARNYTQFVNLLLKRFDASRKRAELTQTYDHCKQNRYKIHVHSLRSYFITKANRVQFGFGHILAGHNFYMKEYNRYTVDELLEMYQKFEPEVTFKTFEKEKRK